MSDRLALPEQMLRTRFVAMLPDITVPDAVAPIEIMVQESITSLCVPASSVGAVAQIVAMYATRACCGVRGVSDAATADAAADAGAQFCWLARPDADLVARLADRGVASVAPALTPTEIETAWRTGASAVLVVPAGVMGSDYSAWLSRLVGEVTVVPAGGMTPYVSRAWLESGASAVGVDDALIADAFTGGSLPYLRDRARNLADIARDFPVSDE